jgi:hypothetical protein
MKELQFITLATNTAKQRYIITEEEKGMFYIYIANYVYKQGFSSDFKTSNSLKNIKNTIKKLIEDFANKNGQIIKFNHKASSIMSLQDIKKTTKCDNSVDSDI